MTVDVSGFRVRPGHGAGLGDRATRVAALCAGKREYRLRLARTAREMAALQAVMAAGQERAVLVVLQAMDAGGKDGTVKHVFSGLNPQGCVVTSFKAPNRDEVRHDFLWRTTARLPMRGEIGVFNRSYYEEVVTTRVHPELLRAEHVAVQGKKLGALFEARFAAINAMERNLVQEGTAVVKVFLHMSKAEQARRLLARIDDPARTWKFDERDMVERERWDDYQVAYGAALAATSTEEAPWFVVPGDDKPTARLIAGGIVLGVIEGMGLAMPAVDAGVRERLGAARERLLFGG